MSKNIRSSFLPAVFTVVCLLAVIMPANAVIQIIDPDGDGSTNVFDNLGMIEFTGSYASTWYPDGSGVGISVGHYDVNSICEPASILACGVGELLVNDGDDIRNQGTNNYIGKNIDSSGKVTLDGHGSSWNLDFGQTGHLYVGQFGTGEVTVSGGADLIAEKVRIGYSDMHDRTGVGTVTVTGNGSTMDDDASLMVGYYGHGTLVVEDEGKVTSNSIDIGYQWNSQGSVTVSGGDTDGNGVPTHLSGTHAIGIYGTGSLTIETGAYAEGNNSYVGRYPDTGGGDAVGMVTVGNDGGGTGLEAQWYIYNKLYIGAKNSSEAGGIGEVTVQEDGRLDVGDTIYIGPLHAGGGSGGTPVVYRGGLTLSGGTVVADAIEILEPDAMPSPLIMESGTLSVVSLTGDLEVTAGTFSPGASPATASINGSYTQAAEGTLLMELGGTTAGTQYDQVHVTDMVDLDGTLEVVLIDGFSPSADDMFDLLDYGSLSGGFATINLPSLSSGLGWDHSDLLVGGQLRVVELLLGGDANGDSLVDVADLGILGANFNQSGMTESDGDFNGDGLVDVADLGVLGANWSAGHAMVTGLALVPEPATLSLVVMGMLLTGRRRC